MTDVESQEQNNLASTAEDASPVKVKAETATKKKSPRSKATHPPTSEMVNSAIKSLKERGGSSVQAIKKYMAANYKVDAEKMAPFIKKFLKSAVASGTIIQTKGKGASGSFKLASVPSKKPDKPAPKPKRKATAVLKKSKARAATAKAASPAKPKKPATTTSPAKKKAAAKARKSPEKKETTSTVAAATKTAAATKAKSPSKAKKTTKSPTKKPKAPKPKTAKKVVAQKSPAKKKASPKKK
nr:late histone H1-like [Onthophagus taurus]